MYCLGQRVNIRLSIERPDSGAQRAIGEGADPAVSGWGAVEPGAQADAVIAVEPGGEFAVVAAIDGEAHDSSVRSIVPPAVEVHGVDLPQPVGEPLNQRSLVLSHGPDSSVR